MSDPLEQSFDRFTMPGRIPDASDPSWRLPPAERAADWLARGLVHPAGRGWAPVAGSSGPVPLGAAFDESPLHHPADGPPPRAGEDYAVRPAPGKGPWPKGWLPGDPPVQCVDADALGAELEHDPAAATRLFDAAARVRFLDCLATLGEVRAAAARVGVSRETCYRARRRWPDFARLWDAALLHARARAEGELASRAYDGTKVPVFVRGECVATWRRHDPRWLAMLLARLDRKAEECGEAAEAAAHFDELLALHAGHEAPEGFADAAGLWDKGGQRRADDEAPRIPTRREYVAWFVSDAIEGVEREDEAPVMAEAREEAEARYDDWREGAMARVDAIVLPEAGDEGDEEGESPLPQAGGAGGGPVTSSATADKPTPNPSRRREGDAPESLAHAEPVGSEADPGDQLPYEIKSATLKDPLILSLSKDPQHRVTGVNTRRRPCALRGTALAGSLGGFYCRTNPALAEARTS